MAKVMIVDQKLMDKWVASRPPVIQGLIRRLPLDRLYRMKSSGLYATMHSYSEDGTVTVSVTEQFNGPGIAFNRRVFGVKPEDLEECDIPPSRKN